MSDFIHSTTLEIRRSVNDPEYSTPPWYKPVDLTQVTGVPSKYWKWDAVNMRPIEMTSGEKATVDAALTKSAEMGQKPSAWVTVLKTAHETRTSNTTLTNDTDLKGTVQPAGKYIFRARIYADTTAAGDFKFAVSGPASPVGVRIAHYAIAAGATAFSAIGVETAFGTSVSVLGTGTNGVFVAIDGEFETNAAGGTVAFQWAQNTSDAGNTRVLAGSYFEFQRIG